jgi:hypothetical protein
MMATQGGCLCGAIRYRAAGDPMDVTLCHCRTCRKAAGAPLVAWVTFPASEFTIVTGTPIRYRSSSKVVRTFCGECGTPLTYAHADFPSGIDITVCSPDEPERFPPADHTWADHRVAWLRANDDLPAYPAARPG